MKFTIFTFKLTVLGVLASSVYSADLDTAVLNYIAAIKTNIPCGIRTLDISSLTPYNRGVYQLNYTSPDIAVNTTLQGIQIYGLTDFDITKFNYDKENGNFTYDLNYPRLKILSKYTSDLRSGGEIKEAFSTTGSINITLINMNLVGSIKFAPNAENHMDISNEATLLHTDDALFNNWNDHLNAQMNEAANSITKNFTISVYKNQHLVDPMFPSVWDVLFSPILKQQLTEEKFITAVEDKTAAALLNAKDCKID